jgi:hypothetical protein
MSNTEQLKGNMPSGIQSFKIAIIAHDGEYYDISNNVTELSLYESIYVPYIHGDLGVVDNSMMLSDFPFIGQERILVSWKRDDKPLTRVFFVTRVANVSRQLDGVGVYELSINSVVQTRNSVGLFSQSYKGRGDEIITDIFDEHLGTTLTPMEGTQAKTSHNIVFPFMKPLQAVDMVQKNVLADDNTPLFVYDTFYPNETRIDSFARMYAREPLTVIEQKKPANTDKDAESTRQSISERGMVYDEAISRGYDTYDGLNKGVFGSTVTITDPSNSEYQLVNFDYKAEAPAIGKDWISDDYVVNGSAVNELTATRNLHLNRNSRSFNNDFPNLNTIDDFDRSILNSYVRRHATTVVKVYMDSIAYTLENDEPFTVGQTVTYNLVRFKPRLSNDEEQLDLVNSGKYIVSAIRHYIKDAEYRMSVELIRDGIGEKAQL